jgi:hypothetical protein
MKHQSLIKNWRKCSLRKPPYFFPGDKEKFKSEHFTLHHSFKKATACPQFCARDDKTFHVGLVPVPYAGNLKTASVFILMLNPGYKPSNYFEERHKDYVSAIKNNLYQRNLDRKYPFLYLDPRFSWVDGFQYWENKFYPLARMLGDRKKKISYQNALKRLSQSIATLELVPYHSRSFNKGSLIKKLPSSLAMIDFVSNVILPRVKKGKAIIIATRGARYWDLPEHPNIVVYNGSEARGSSFSLNSRGGKKIKKFLLK